MTHGQFVATMFVRMLKLPEAERAAFDTSSLRLVVHSAAPVSVEVKEQMIAWLGPILTEFYAGSEGNGFCVIDSPTWLRHKGSVGKPILGEVHICADDGDELPTGEIGTVWFSGTRRFSYHNDPVKTAGVYNDKGWSTLGDMGSVDAEGYLYLADRRTDLILSGGVNIYPREIEDALALHPAVADIVVFGIPDEEMGQRVHAVVQPAVPGSGTPELAAGADRLLPRADRALQGAPVGLVRGRAAPAAVRQDAAPAADGPLPVAAAVLTSPMNLGGLAVRFRFPGGRSTSLRTLPEGVRGSSSTSATTSGVFCRAAPAAAKWARAWSTSKVNPGRATTTAQTRSPSAGSGTGMTATSATAGWVISRSSTSLDEMFSPPRMMMSLSRSVTVRYPPASIRPMSPVRNQPPGRNAAAFSAGSV